MTWGSFGNGSLGGGNHVPPMGSGFSNQGGLYGQGSNSSQGANSGHGGQFFDQFMSQQMTPEQNAESQGYRQISDGSWEKGAQWYGPTQLRSTGQFGREMPQGRDQLQRLLMGDLQAHEAAENMNYAQGQQAIADFRQATDQSVNQVLDQGQQGGQMMIDRSQELFDFGTDFLASQEARVNSAQEDAREQNLALLSTANYAQQKQFENSIRNLESGADRNSPHVRAQIAQARHDSNAMTMGNLAQIKQGMDAQQNQMAMAGVQNLSQAAGVTTNFANMASQQYSNGVAMQNASTQYAANLRVQGRGTEAQMIQAFEFSPVASTPVFMAMMGYDMNPFTETYQGMDSGYMGGFSS